MRTQNRFNRGKWIRTASISAIFAMVSVIAGCDNVAEAGRTNGQPDANSLYLLAFNASELGWSAVIPAFAATPESGGTTVRASFGASGDQGRRTSTGR